jgi:uncharacterized protein
MYISFLGGAKEVGASCMLLELQGKRILLDCGIRQGSSKDILPDFRTIQERGGVDAIVISHAHMDHTGSLPVISKEYPSARIYMNNMTRDLVKVLLYDSLKIMNSREAEIPLYVERDVEDMLNRVFVINYQRQFEILEGIKLSFYQAGHIAGASAVYLSSEEGSLFYSGDFSVFPQRTIEGAKIPKLRPDMAIFESTYGDKLHSSREAEEEKLIELLREDIQDNSKMLIPAFALGRAQEVLLILKSAINRGKLPKVKIYVDGMIKDINRVYKNNPLYLKSSLGRKILRGVEPFYDDNISPVSNKEEREKILQGKDPVVIISSSGMMTGGPSQYYGEHIAAMENGYIIMSGYQDEEAPGRKLLNLIELSEEGRVLEINNKSLPVKCKIEKVGLSAHGDKNEIKALIEHLAPKSIFFVHGEEGIIESLAKELIGSVRARIYAPRLSETIEVRINAPRKQLHKQFMELLNSNKDLNAETIKELWNFVRDAYGDRFFTLEELLIIYRGKEDAQEEELEQLKSLIIGTPYFENDLRRFFMFKAKSKEVVEEELKPKELKPNEINDLVREYFSEYDYKKVSLKLSEKTVVLNFDFPRAISSDIYEKMSSFKDNTELHIEINPQTNNNAAENLIRSLMTEVNIKKISFQLNEAKVLVLVDNPEDNYEKEKEEFKERTGLQLVFSMQGMENNILSKSSEVMLAGDIEALEQNTALYYIDESFREEAFKPYKKSIKGKGIMELAFISPVVGKRYIEKLKDLAKEIGWNLSISSSVNQNEILNLAIRLCQKEGIKLSKNPSFNPSSLKVKIKVGTLEEGNLEKIKRDFGEATGCELEW